MLYFNNDYHNGAHPSILESLILTNNTSYPGYGQDSWCSAGKARICDLIASPQASVHFVVGGTQANALVISSALRSYQSPICADTGHINVHETGAIEAKGHKILTAPHQDGKLQADDVERIARLYETSDIPEHITQPRMVCIAQSTETGSVYSKHELEALSAVCKKHDLFLFIDGARLAYGLTSAACDVTLPDLATFADVFTIGGTKCGALFGEAIVITNPILDDHFRSYEKQFGAMLAKGWLLGLQFSKLLEDENDSLRYFNLARHANEQAQRIASALIAAGFSLEGECVSNQIFVIMPNDAIETLGTSVVYSYDHAINDSTSCIRLCTSWSTPDEDVEDLITIIQSL